MVVSAQISTCKIVNFSRSNCGIIKIYLGFRKLQSHFQLQSLLSHNTLCKHLSKEQRKTFPF